MKKVLVIGSSGSGKSTFSRRLGAATGLEVVHLDKLFWHRDWVETPKDEWRKVVADVCRKDSWIIDGNYSGTMDVRIPFCDTVIFLDFPRTVCVSRILKRVAFYKKGSRPDMAEGCDEKFNWEFIKWTWDYPTRSKPRVEKLLEKVRNEKTIIRLTSNRDVENFFVNLETNKVKSP
jgi:adenylate kinase family enzyme